MDAAHTTIVAATFVALSACGGSTTIGPGNDGGAKGEDAANEAGGPRLTCNPRTSAAAELVRAAAEEAQKDLSCQAPEDCLVVWTGTDCSDTCSVLVNRQGAEKVEAAMAEANATVCRGFSDDGCILVSPPCAAPRRWACVGDTCTVVTGHANLPSTRWP